MKRLTLTAIMALLVVGLTVPAFANSTTSQKQMSDLQYITTAGETTQKLTSDLQLIGMVPSELYSSY